jgi:hypothetical protein
LRLATTWTFCPLRFVAREQVVDVVAFSDGGDEPVDERGVAVGAGGDLGGHR